MAEIIVSGNHLYRLIEIRNSRHHAGEQDTVGETFSTNWNIV
jgi:hypothetical protein